MARPLVTFSCWAVEWGFSSRPAGQRLRQALVGGGPVGHDPRCPEGSKATASGDDCRLAEEGGLQRPEVPERSQTQAGRPGHVQVSAEGKLRPPRHRRRDSSRSISGAGECRGRRCREPFRPWARSGYLCGGVGRGPAFSPSGLKAITPSSGFPTSARCSAGTGRETSSLRGPSGRSFRRCGLPSHCRGSVGGACRGRRPMKARVAVHRSAAGGRAHAARRSSMSEDRLPARPGRLRGRTFPRKRLAAARVLQLRPDPDVAASVRRGTPRLPGAETQSRWPCLFLGSHPGGAAMTFAMGKLHLAMATQARHSPSSAEAGRPRTLVPAVNRRGIGGAGVHLLAACCRTRRANSRPPSVAASSRLFVA